MSMIKQLRLTIEKAKRKLKMKLLSRPVLTLKNLMSLSMSKINRNPKHLLKFYKSSQKKLRLHRLLGTLKDCIPLKV